MKTFAVILASLAAFAEANQELLFGRAAPARALFEIEKSTDRWGPSYNLEGQEPNSTSQIGMILGFLAYGGFLLFSLVMLIRSEVMTHSQYSSEVEEKIKILKDEYGCTDTDIQNMREEFVKEQSSKKEEASDDIALVN